MENSQYSELIEQLRFVSNKLSDVVEYFDFNSLEIRKIREAENIIDNKVFELEEFKNEEEYWS